MGPHLRIRRHSVVRRWADAEHNDGPRARIAITTVGDLEVDTFPIVELLLDVHRTTAADLHPSPNSRMTPHRHTFGVKHRNRPRCTRGRCAHRGRGGVRGPVSVGEEGAQHQSAEVSAFSW